MLIELSVKNYRSLKERQTLSLVAASGGELRDTNTVSVLDGKLSLVRSAAIYGPNASGKSNLINALYAMQRMVRDSAQNQHSLDLPFKPYSFDRATQEQPTEFDASFLYDGVRYQYGFIATRQQVLEEWLYAYPKGRAQTWIERRYNPHTQMYEWGNTDKLTGPKQLWQNVTRPNALFLSTAVQLNNQQLRPVSDWFEFKLGFLTGTGPLPPKLTANYCNNLSNKQKVITLLQTADFSIKDFTIKSEQEDLEITLKHLGPDGEHFSLDYAEESDGTQKFFAFAGPWLRAFKEGLVLFVDELNDNLHADLVKFLVQLFHDPHINRRNAQLVFTTHETSILQQEIFRRDQIWFTEKDEYNATTLYPLSDFSPRKGVENLEKNYLQGRYGALPYLRDTTSLLETANGA